MSTRPHVHTADRAGLIARAPKHVCALPVDGSGCSLVDGDKSRSVQH